MVIFGVDPGTVSMGYGVIRVAGDKVTLVTYGALAGKTKLPLAQRLFQLYEKLDDLVRRNRPSEVAIEEPFVGENRRSALAVGRAQAIAMLVAARRHLPVYTYTPAQVKQAVTSYGASDKQQVQEMVRLSLDLAELPQPDDAADALAVALCHQRQTYLAHLLEARPPNV